jgi:D-alanyl-D-alanine dipeptidase
MLTRRPVSFALVALLLWAAACRPETPGRVVDDPSTATPSPRPAADATPDRRPLAGPRVVIGDYAAAGDTLIVREHEGRIEALIDGHAYPLEHAAGATFRLAGEGPAAGRAIRFETGDTGIAGTAVLDGTALRRLPYSLPHGHTFRIEPVRPVEELRRQAMAATPPLETNHLRQPDLVDLATLDPTFRFDIRYATTDNFMGTAFYDEPRAVLQRPAADALLRAHRRLRDHGLGILVHDAYRPWFVTWMLWHATPGHQKVFVADPAVGSRHNRGAAVDLTLYALDTGEPVPMPSGYDEFSPRAFPGYPGGTTAERRNRDLLRRTMEAEGFRVYHSEWWHFDHRDWNRYPILNVSFEGLDLAR